MRLMQIAVVAVMLVPAAAFRAVPVDVRSRAVAAQSPHLSNLVMQQSTILRSVGGFFVQSAQTMQILFAPLPEQAAHVAARIVQCVFRPL